MSAQQIVEEYYAAFNRGDRGAMLAMLAEDVAHHPNADETRFGKDAFRAFLVHMDACYDEELEDIVVMASPNGDRAAAEFTVRGRYKATDAGLPEARGQGYALPAGAFFTILGGRISRVTTYYNLEDWKRQVGA